MLDRLTGQFVDRFDFPRRRSIDAIVKELAQGEPTVHVGTIAHREFRPEDQGAGGLTIAVTAYRPLGAWHLTYDAVSSVTLNGIVGAHEVEAAFRSISTVAAEGLPIEVRRRRDHYELSYAGAEELTVVNDGAAVTLVEPASGVYRIPYEPEASYLTGTYATAESVSVSISPIVANTDGTGTDLLTIEGVGDAHLTLSFDGATTDAFSADATTCEIQALLLTAFPSTVWRVERADRRKWLIHRTRFDPSIADPIKQFGYVDVPEGASDVYIPWTFETAPEEVYFTAAQNDSDIIAIEPDWSSKTAVGMTVNLDAATTEAGMRVYWFALAAAKTINFDSQGEVEVEDGNDLEITHGLSEAPGFISLTVESPSGELYKAWPVASTIDDTSFTIRWDGAMTSATVRWAVFSSGVQRVAKVVGTVSISEGATEATVPFSNVLTGDPVAAMLILRDEDNGPTVDIGIGASIGLSGMTVEFSGAVDAGKELHYVITSADSDALNPTLGCNLKSYSKSYGLTGTPTISDVADSTRYRLKLTNVGSAEVLYNQVSPGNLLDIL